MYGRKVCAGEDGGGDAEDLDEKTRFQYLAVLQYLRDHELLEALSALEQETGVRFEDGDLPVASVLEASLDMFSRYGAGAGAGGGEADSAARADEEELQKVERGACCTGPCAEGMGPNAPLSANVTAVAWAAAQRAELVALAATADRRLRLLGSDGEVLAEVSNLASPLLGLDVAPSAEEVLATSMSGEALLLRIRRPAPDPDGSQATGGASAGWALEISQRFRDHEKHVTSGRFAPVEGEEEQTNAEPRAPAYFVTVSRDHQARLYSRTGGAGGDFAPAGAVRLGGEVTCCCWPNAQTFVLAARDDHNLRYYDVDGGPDGGPHERLRTNLNMLGDSVVSFAVLALAVSPDRRLIAACTDKSRVIVLRAFTERQVRNLYGAVVDEYDVPSICFSLDQSFLYATSSLPQKSVRRPNDEDEGEEILANGLCGQVVTFEVRTGEAVLRLPCHEKAVRCMSRHPSSEYLVTGSFDKTVKYWG